MNLTKIINTATASNGIKYRRTTTIQSSQPSILASRADTGERKSKKKAAIEDLFTKTKNSDPEAGVAVAVAVPAEEGAEGEFEFEGKGSNPSLLPPLPLPPPPPDVPAPPPSSAALRAAEAAGVRQGAAMEMVK